MLSYGCLNFECATCLMDECVWTVAAIFPYLCFGKKSHSWSNTECRLDVLLKRPDEKFSSSGRMMLWTVGRPGGISCHLNCCKGFNFSGL
jgi:hypothetical protein